jgi:hypothetical protein
MWWTVAKEAASNWSSHKDGWQGAALDAARLDLPCHAPAWWAFSKGRRERAFGFAAVDIDSGGHIDCRRRRTRAC